MDKIVGEYYIIKDMIFKNDILNNQFNTSSYQLYEVMRTSNGVILFLDDHLLRFQDSLKTLGYIEFYFADDIKKCLYKLLKINNNLEGNVKMVCRFEHNCLIYATYYIPHFYPHDHDYVNGIKLKTYVIDRNQPNIKQIQVNEFIKTSISDILLSKKYYEVLMINHEGYISEGSKSNFFLLKDRTLYSAPESWILKGITRKYVLEIAYGANLKCIEKSISKNELIEYESAFICGTSPKVLPVNEIDDISFNTQNITLQYIINEYNKLLKQQLEKTDRNK